MGIHDRPYMQPGHEGRPGGGYAFGLPHPGKAVKCLLIANLAVFVLQIFFDQPTAWHGGGVMSAYLGATVSGSWQVWRYVTFQFLHSTSNLFHVGLNMLGLYMLGTPLERHWGTRRFLAFYLSCGTFAGVAFVAIRFLAGQVDSVPLVGASGGVYGVVLACAVLFPHFRVVMLFFLVPIRLLAVIVFGAMLLAVMISARAGHLGAEFWSNVAHLGGAVAAAVWIWVVPRMARSLLPQALRRRRRGAWRRKMKRQAEEQSRIDGILQKIHDQGINSLTRREKKLLRQATQRQQHEERELRRL